MIRAIGIDVSHYHPVSSWAEVVAARFGGQPISFFGAKATQGTTMVDPTFVKHRDGFRAARVSAPQLLMAQYYHYCGGGDPKTEANHFLQTVGPPRPNERLVLDVEGKLPPTLPWIQEFIAALPPKPVPFVYTSARIWQAMGNPAWPDATVGNVELWAPRYGYAEPQLPSPWSFWRFWQFSETFNCPGVESACDASNFNGTMDDLAKYLGVATPQLVA